MRLVKRTLCDVCGFMWQAYVLDPLGMHLLYEHWISAEESLAKRTHADVTLFEQYAREVARISRILGGNPHRIRVLDFGMGWGFWCRMASAFGYEVEGLDLSEARRKYARERGVRVVDRLPTEPTYD
jgi:2-polyprenyl-3-methyl-5-hydroxy-6-metoxy-1,4-benzoquinol methylase